MQVAHCNLNVSHQLLKYTIAQTHRSNLVNTGTNNIETCSQLPPSILYSTTVGIPLWTVPWFILAFTMIHTSTVAYLDLPTYLQLGPQLSALLGSLLVSDLSIKIYRYNVATNYHPLTTPLSPIILRYPNKERERKGTECSRTSNSWSENEPSIHGTLLCRISVF
jgi:hypothetical protein